MMSNKATASRGCMCGAVRYELTGDPIWRGYCHCHSCRRHTGAPVVAWVTLKSESVKWIKGERTHYESSPGKFRGFCRDRGTPLTWESTLSNPPEIAGLKVTEIHISTLDEPDDFQPTEHIYFGERITWFDTSDDLPRHVAAP